MEHFYQNIGEDWFTYPSFYRGIAKRFDSGKFLEIGSWKGRSAAFLAVEIINNNKNIEFYCVDTWLGSSEHFDMEEIKNDQLYKMFLNNIEPVKDVIKPIRKASLDAVNDFEDEFFDFIFIDAAHDYENVSKDLRAWYPKLKKGGIFSGHDYSTWPEVTRAVDEWVNENNLELIIKGEEFVWALKK